MQGRMEGGTSPPGMEEENDWFFLGRLLFRKAWLLSYQSLPDSWRASCCALPSTGGNLRLYHRKWRPHQPTSSEISLGNSTGSMCIPLHVPLLVKALAHWHKRHFWFYFFCGKAPLLKLWRKDEKKGKANATHIFTSLSNCSDESGNPESSLVTGKILISLESSLQKWNSGFGWHSPGAVASSLTGQVESTWALVCCRTVRSLTCFASVTVPSPHFKFKNSAKRWRLGHYLV